MKKLILPAFAVLLLAACHDKNQSVQPARPALVGGKGGNFSIVVFTKSAGASVSARVFLEYAASAAIADTGNYNEKATAQEEPPLGAHVHFTNLLAGTYFIRAMDNGKIADTSLYITDGSPAETDITLNLK